MKHRRRVLVLSGWLHPQIAAGLAAFAREANWHLYLATMLSRISPRHLACDGLLAFHSERAEMTQLARKQAAHCPTVLISGMKPIVDAPVVKEDNVGVGRMAAQHFLERGFRQFAWVSNDSRQVSQERRAGFLVAIREAGMPCHCLEWQKEEALQWRDFSRRLVKQLKALPHPLAVLALDDMLAVDIVEVCRDNQLHVPEDVAVLGVGNAPLICEFSEVPLSSIEIDWGEMVYRGAALLDRLMSGRRAPKEPLVLPPRCVVTRTSTDMLATSNPYLTDALQFVRDHFCEPIGVRDVARAAGVTRRTLEVHFRRHLRHTLAEEIRQRRLHFAQDLLLNTDLTVAEIAAQSGFGTALYLAKVFKRALGIQPSRYREKHRRPNRDPSANGW